MDEEKDKRIIKQSEIKLWLEAVRDVIPFNSSKAKDGTLNYKHPAREKKEIKDRSEKSSRQIRNNNPPGTDRRTAEKLRKGKIPVDRRLDLHGLTQAQAQDKLQKTLTDFYVSGSRVILVITGKGSTKKASENWLDPEPGVLRNKLPVWLQSPPLDGIVLDFCHARQKDGGQGAFYVLLRRKRG
jgi:DNA-nicking Smr family endonuclease